MMNFHSNHTSVVLYLSISLQLEIQKWCNSYHKPAQTLGFIPSFSCHICSYKGLHLFYPEGWIPFWTKQKWKSGGKKPAFMGKKWGNGCLWDINLPFEMSCWQKSSKGFTLPQELRFWKKYDRLMGKEWIYNAACLKTLQTLSGYPKQLALQVSRGSQASSGECPAPAARQGCWVTRARWIRGGCTPIRSLMYNF